LACGMLDELTQAFGEHIGIGFDFYGEGFCIPPATDQKVAPYLGTTLSKPKE
jgi:hypothetical protein